ncbi:MAG: RagB/SusD family nutrient uptake outer membrane protein [Bacteroidales bacterium]|nr:RagB/SusD family nutrient uptake outer membrane protein [Bacteroidales bacterium]
MRNIHNKILIGAAGLALLSLATSCEEYLDKAPDTTVTAEDAFKDFNSMQGYVEGVYTAIPDKEKCHWCPSWNWGDDELMNPEADDRFTHQADLGNFKAWQETGNWLYHSTDGNPGYHFGRLWTEGWGAIRKCNMAIENISKMVGTDEERNLILGQAYFFRAWFHFEMMEFLGGLPYIDKVFEDGMEFKEARLSYQKCAEKCAADFRKAADLLPINWDDTEVSSQYGLTGKNKLRVNKITALGYLGKNYLWAGSPLMKNGCVGEAGGAKTYIYDETYCKKAAEAFRELLDLVESGETQYSLAEFNFDKSVDKATGVARGIYDHKKASGAKNCYSDIFYTVKNNWLMPGSTEAIMQGLSGENNNANNCNWNTSKVFGPKVAGLVEHDNVIHMPTANLIDQYGMANGLPIDDPKSGFDPTHPFKDRDPRFYHDIVFDGFKYVNSETLEKSKEYLRYCSLYTGGAMRAQANGSQTGYFIQKLVPHTMNIADRDYDWGGAFHCYIPFMRLGDIYLMYAEASAASGDEAAAVNAINVIRTRCGAGELGADYKTGTKLMDEIRRERAVELAFEGFRFNDLQRWLLLTEPKYTTKYAHEFDRAINPADMNEDDEKYWEAYLQEWEKAESQKDEWKNMSDAEKDQAREAKKKTKEQWYVDNWCKYHDSKDMPVVNFRKRNILTRRYEPKHYWFPFPESIVYLYPEFKQNTGW